MIEKDYRAWIRTGSPLEAARDPLLWQHARRAEKAWHEVRRHGVADGPAAVTRQAHASQHRQPQRPARMSDDHVRNRKASMPQHSSQREDSRELVFLPATTRAALAVPRTLVSTPCQMRSQMRRGTSRARLLLSSG